MCGGQAAVVALALGLGLAACQAAPGPGRPVPAAAGPPMQPLSGFQIRERLADRYLSSRTEPGQELFVIHHHSGDLLMKFMPAGDVYLGSWHTVGDRMCFLVFQSHGVRCVRVQHSGTTVRFLDDAGDVVDEFTILPGRPEAF